MKKTLFTFILGTRPEIIKLSPLIRLCQNKRVPFKIIHSGQHYSYAMDRVFFSELKLPMPDYRLDIRSKAPHMQGEHTGRMLIEIEKILLKDMPKAVIVQGDTNTALAGAMTADKISTTKSYTGFEIKVAHVEAGLRSYDRSMPEEINRFLVDHISDFLFVPTAIQKNIVLKEGVPSDNVFVTGNTIVDAVRANLALAGKKKAFLSKIGVKKGNFILLTLHRQENVDSEKTFRRICRGINLVTEKFGMSVVFPVHPRTEKKIRAFDIEFHNNVKVLRPLDFLTFLYAESTASLILTDSGGVQEEACMLKVPCVTLRDNTERPETIKVGANIISGRDPDEILKASLKMIEVRRDWPNPFGDGKASSRMLDILLRKA
ncbi:MAG: UDP-N-acetylglucosamine 2-epimerase [Omnitrophica bacterium RIFCSPLOWO2_02_FULL_45_16]|nr:MAG: UDP-N-acetylglucosamine 2-epimerase [Omnitrophica bacterium RIFCSPLOWO2_02_FULL_45_16]